MQKLDFFGLKITSFTNEELIKYAVDSVNYNNSRIFYGYSLTIIPLFRKYRNLYWDANNSDIIVCDGAVFYRLVKTCGLMLKSNLSIPEMTRLFIKLANDNGYSIYLLGAKGKVNQLARENIINEYSNISVNGRDGYFNVNEQEKIISEIKKERPNIILIGITTPYKEQLAIKMREENCGNIIIPCGGMIDVLAGKTKQTPRILKRLGLATFYRLIQEPHRLLLRYLISYYHIFFKIIPNIFFACIFHRKNFKLIDLYKEKF